MRLILRNKETKGTSNYKETKGISNLLVVWANLWLGINLFRNAFGRYPRPLAIAPEPRLATLHRVPV
jgi:hypothetical protein